MSDYAASALKTAARADLKQTILGRCAVLCPRKIDKRSAIALVVAGAYVNTRV
jgi:hypothetical protein